MKYTSLKECVNDLEQTNQLLRIREEVDPHLEAAAIHRKVYAQKGPAILFDNLKGCSFPAVSNLFGTKERAQYVFRSTLINVKKAVQLKANPGLLAKKMPQYVPAAIAGLKALPRKRKGGPVLFGKTTLSQLPQITCWPEDGGAFILLPQVYSEDPLKPGIAKSNLGMYRIQISGNDYVKDREVGLHYQIKRGIGVHHMHALAKNEPLKVSIFVGGPPAHTFAAVMPLPEGLPEVAFGGCLAGRRFRYTVINGYTISLDADFCITGKVYPGKTKPEGPFGDHLGYYSLTHDFPYLEVEDVYHREDAIWPFTVVGRPPAEDSVFGEIIHEITEPMVPVSLPGVHQIHAVDVAGVHPLLFATGRESYKPYDQKENLELMTLANAILGFGQCSLAKYLFIAKDNGGTGENSRSLDIYDEQGFIEHFLTHTDFATDLHFQTETSMDTLDYSGGALNRGSKLIVTASGKAKRTLDDTHPGDLNLTTGFASCRVVSPGILAIEAPSYEDHARAKEQVAALASQINREQLHGFPLIVLTEDSTFLATDYANFLWVTFTRSNPSHDLYGVDSFYHCKHWGAHGSLIIDARLKPHLPPPLVPDEKTDQAAAEKLTNYGF